MWQSQFMASEFASIRFLTLFSFGVMISSSYDTGDSMGNDSMESALRLEDVGCLSASGIWL